MVGMSREGVSSSEFQMPANTENNQHPANNDLKLAIAYAVVLAALSLIPISSISEIIPLIGVVMLFFIPLAAALVEVFWWNSPEPNITESTLQNERPKI